MSDNVPSSDSGHRALAGRHRAPASQPAADPVTAVNALRTALCARGVTCTWIKPVDQDTAMLIAGERIVVCRDGLFWWATGKFRSGRTVLTIHAITDPDGAARRLVRAEAGAMAAGTSQARSPCCQARR